MSRPTSSRAARPSVRAAVRRAELARADFPDASDRSGRRLVLLLPDADVTDPGSDASAAVGLGRALRAAGWQVAYVVGRRPVPGADVAVGLAPDLLSAASDVPVRVAWLRSNPEDWLRRPELGTYDLVLAPSRLALAATRRTFAGESALFLPAVDVEDIRQGAHRPRLRRTVVRAVEVPPAGRYPDRLPPDLLLAIAAGELPVASTALGLGDLGLTEVPVGRSAAERTALVRRLLADRRAAAARSERLAEAVRRAHTWRHRATTLAEALERARTRPRRVVGFFPDFRRTNPYQDMLYCRAVEEGIGVVPVPDIRRGPAPHTTSGRLDGYALHLHWTSAVVGPAQDEAEATRRLDSFRGTLDELAQRGGKLVWTVHNVLPHENRWPDQEAELHDLLCARADLVHVMNRDTVAATAGAYELPAERVRVVPHAGYVGIYPDVVSREEARHRLGLLPSDRVVLFAGAVRPYKGIDLLLDAFDAVLPDNPRLRLLVAGRVDRFPGDAELAARIRDQRRAVVRLEYVPDGDLQLYYRAADLCALPYRTILNSGSIQLALSFGVPVVVPALPTLVPDLRPEWSETFEPGSAADLGAALLRAERLVSRDARRAAHRAAAAYPAEAMSRDFVAAVRPLLAAPC